MEPPPHAGAWGGRRCRCGGLCGRSVPVAGVLAPGSPALAGGQAGQRPCGCSDRKSLVIWRLILSKWICSRLCLVI